jgi:hypothetical protein
MREIKHHISDPPMLLRSNDVLEDTHFIGTGTAYGRVLFTETTMVEASGENITVRNCRFSGFLDVKPFTRWQRIKWRWLLFKADLRFLQSINQHDPSILRNVVRLKLRWFKERHFQRL